TGNPCALLSPAHQAALVTRRDPDRRYGERLRLVRYLLNSRLKRDIIRKLLKLINWLTGLPLDLEFRSRTAVETLTKVEGIMTIDEMKWPHEIAEEEIGHARGLIEALLDALE